MDFALVLGSVRFLFWFGLGEQEKKKNTKKKYTIICNSDTAHGRQELNAKTNTNPKRKSEQAQRHKPLTALMLSKPIRTKKSLFEKN